MYSMGDFAYGYIIVAVNRTAITRLSLLLRAVVAIVPRAPRALVPHVTRALCTLVTHVSRVLCGLVPHALHALPGLLAHVSRALRAFLPQVLRAPRAVVAQMLSFSCLTWPFCFVSCVLHASITFSALVFPCFTWLFLIYFELVWAFSEFTTAKIKIICS